jgi:hypothetical protein
MLGADAAVFSLHNHEYKTNTVRRRQYKQGEQNAAIATAVPAFFLGPHSLSAHFPVVSAGLCGAAQQSTVEVPLLGPAATSSYHQHLQGRQRHGTGKFEARSGRAADTTSAATARMAATFLFGCARFNGMPRWRCLTGSRLCCP